MLWILVQIPGDFSAWIAHALFEIATGRPPWRVRRVVHIGGDNAPVHASSIIVGRQIATRLDDDRMIPRGVDFAETLERDSGSNHRRVFQAQIGFKSVPEAAVFVLKFLQFAQNVVRRSIREMVAIQGLL